MEQTPTFLESGARVRILREENGLDQIRFARMLGISRSSLAQIEERGRAISPPTARKVAGLLGVSIDELLAPVHEQTLVDSFRAQGHDEEFLKDVSFIEKIAREMLGQVHLAEQYGHYSSYSVDRQRQSLHRLIDGLSEDSLQKVARLLQPYGLRRPAPK